ncbi:MAG: RNA polymerase-binding protein DksA [Rhodospirillales bacterium]|nr:RNA polymerase-binding protein DksA [Rhodospirillales bacterium]MBC93406.1 RNA polymerase-binding protein DksA [Rhodospirillaceae bacterium]|tara:strand:- start:808 stop:1227 length:420 start_codon:yes stop_codon:yes gene_type:complete
MSTTLLPPDYVPSDEDDFMNPLMTEFFRQRLIEWRNELVRESDQTLINIQTTNNQEPDISDRASLESNRALELRTRDRGRKLISKIDAALRRIDDGEYGYCEVTGDTIDIRRLIARPIATLSVEAQERHERMEKTHRDS